MLMSEYERSLGETTVDAIDMDRPSLGKVRSVETVSVDGRGSCAADSRRLLGITRPLGVCEKSASLAKDDMDIVLSSCRSGIARPCAVVWDILYGCCLKLFAGAAL